MLSDFISNPILILKNIKKWPKDFNDIAKKNKNKYDLCNYQTIKLSIYFVYLVSTKDLRDAALNTNYQNMIKGSTKTSFNRKCGNPKKLSKKININHIALRICSFIDLYNIYDQDISGEMVDKLIVSIGLDANQILELRSEILKINKSLYVYFDEFYNRFINLNNNDSKKTQSKDIEYFFEIKELEKFISQILNIDSKEIKILFDLAFKNKNFGIVFDKLNFNKLNKHQMKSFNEFLRKKNIKIDFLKI